MKEKNIIGERDREATEKRLLDTIEQIIVENGFEKIGVNAVAAQSGVSKILIYRYFGSIDGLMAAYIQQHDFWINFPLEVPGREHLPVFLKRMFRGQVEQLRSNPTLRRLHRWELSCDNAMIVKLREQRELIGMNFIEKVCELTGFPRKEVEVMASIVTASITYLVMLEEFCPVYNGIAIKEDTGWAQISEGVDTLVDKYFKNDNNGN